MSIALKNKIAEDQLIKISRMKPVIKPTVPHKHDGYHEIIFLSKGSGYHIIDDAKVEMVGQMAFYLRQGQVHCWEFDQIPAGYVVLFKESVFDFQRETLNKLFLLPTQFRLEKEPASGLFALLDQFYGSFKNDEGTSILASFLELTILKTLNLAKNQPHLPPALINDFYKLKTLIDQHFISHRSTGAYADMLHMSVSRLNRLSQAVSGSSTSELIKARLLVEAKNLLTHTNHNISQIAHQLNFTDASNFVKFFKSQTGITPNDFKGRLAQISTTFS